MSTESHLREKLGKIEVLFAGAGTTGERLTAEGALEPVRERLAELGRQDPQAWPPTSSHIAEHLVQELDELLPGIGAPLSDRTRPNINLREDLYAVDTAGLYPEEPGNRPG
jgi:hypothetical protein